jgi:hypothetical protein
MQEAATVMWNHLSNLGPDNISYNKLEKLAVFALLLAPDEQDKLTIIMRDTHDKVNSVHQAKRKLDSKRRTSRPRARGLRSLLPEVVAKSRTSASADAAQVVRGNLGTMSYFGLYAKMVQGKTCWERLCEDIADFCVFFQLQTDASF